MFNVVGFAIVLLCGTFMMMSFWQGIVKSSELKYRSQAEQYEVYMKMQEEQIKNIIVSDERMRLYRHNMKAHMTILQALSKKGGDGELNRYLSDMMQDVILTESRQYTGNTAIDAIINQMLSMAETRDIHTEIQMTLPEKYEISDYELCTLISNLLQNAVEASEKNMENRKIEISLYPYEKKMYLICRNTTNAQIQIINNRLETSKQDRKNHGLGSVAVRNIVEKYGGVLSYSCKDGWFEAEIIL